MKLRIYSLMALAGLVILFGVVPVCHGQISDNDLLIDKLVQKGFLTPIEASILKDRTKEYVAEHMAEGRMIDSPKWTQKIKIHGDVRLRNQYEKRKGISESRHRGRLRARVGMDVRVNDDISTGIGITTSNDGDPRSTNVTFTDSFERADLRIDYAHIEYSPVEHRWISLIGGKFRMGEYLWKPSSLLWDSDVNPAGVGIHLEKDINRNVTLFSNLNGWMIDELTSSAEDAGVIAIQPGLKYENNSLDATLAGTFYNFRHLRGKRLDNTSCSNTGLTLFGVSCIGSLDNEFRVAGGSFEAGYRRMIHEEYKRVAIFGEYYVNDRAPSKINTAWSAGVKFGDLKLDDFGDWQVMANYINLEQDAFPDVFPDSDRYGGQTGIEGYDLSLKFGLTKNVLFNLSYYRYEKITSVDSQRLQDTVIQGDILVKF